MKLRKIISLLLAMMMACAMIPTMASADEEINFIFGLNNTWTTLFPYNHASSYSTQVWDALYEPLVCIQDSVVYRNAESIDISEDFTQWTVHLNPACTWSDGVPTTAEDWVWTFQTVTNPDFGVWNDTIQMNVITGTTSAGLLEEGAELGVELVDDYTFILHFKSAVTLDTFACIRTSYWHAMPKHLLSDMPVSEIATSEYWLAPVGNGCCTFVEEVVTGNELLLKARKDYYLGTPEFDYLTFKVLDSSNIANAFLTGEIDTCYSAPGASTRATLVGQNGLHADADPYCGTTQSLVINNRRFSARVRKAFDMLIDKTLLATVIGGEGSYPVGDMYLPTMSYNLPYEHSVDVEGAIAILKEEGYDFDYTIKRGASNTSSQQNTAAIIKQNLEAAGLKVEIVTQEFSQLNAMQRAGELDCIFLFPFYYIDYALAQTCAFQLFIRSMDDREAAWQDYLRLCRAGGSKGYFALLETAHLANPFVPGTLKDVIQRVAEQLEVFRREAEGSANE